MIERHKSGYTRIPGSDRLLTGKGVALDEDASKLTSVDVGGHKLGRVVLREAFVPVVASVFDVLALEQEPEELAVYMHLWRLSVGEERNWCRVSRAELERRVRMSQLRLGKALAGLVDKGHIALVDRNREGTLYRVLLPHEVARTSGSPPSARHGAAATTAPAPVPPAPAPPSSQHRATTTTALAPAPPSSRHRATTTTPAPAPLSSRHGAATPAAPPSSRHGAATTRAFAAVSELVRWFGDVGGRGRGRTPEEVLEEVLALVEDGVALDDIRAALERFAKEMPKKAPVSELARFVR